MFKVLLVTDSPWVEEDVRAELDGGEFEVETVSSGPEAVAVARKSPPDIVVADIQVGSMGGPAIAADIRNELDERVASTPVVVLLDRQADAWICRKLGVSQVLVKPFEPGRLERILRQLLKRRTSPAPLGS